MLLGEISRELLTCPLTKNEMLMVLFRLTIFGAATYFSIKWVSDALDPTRKQRIQLKKKTEHLMKQIGVEGVKLTEHEMNIAAHLVVPKDIKVTWMDIAGLDEMVGELQDTVILPFRQRHLFRHSKLCQPPRDESCWDAAVVSTPEQRLLYARPGNVLATMSKTEIQALFENNRENLLTQGLTLGGLKCWIVRDNLYDTHQHTMDLRTKMPGDHGDSCTHAIAVVLVNPVCLIFIGQRGIHGGVLNMKAFQAAQYTKNNLQQQASDTGKSLPFHLRLPPAPGDIPNVTG